MILTKETRREITRLLGDLIKLKGTMEMVDGPLIGGVLSFSDRKFGELIPEPLQTLLRESLHKIFVDKNYETIGEDLVLIILELVKLLDKDE